MQSRKAGPVPPPFAGSRLPGLMASNIQVEGNLRLTDCHVTGELRLPRVLDL
ncbi:hypothetical protein [Nonomuraea sp. 10N515B]|uniref:hypothetical protein n=1 Tax=Nonomuraea sp. 10N515B TaxID=3457422 RepID=UPI003FCCF338